MRLGLSVRSAGLAQDVGYEVNGGALVSTLLIAWLSCTAQAQTLGGLGSVAGETDADHFSTLRLRAGGLFAYQSPLQYLGVAAQQNLYSQSTWHAHATGVVGLWRDQARDTLAGINAEAGVVEVAGHTRPVGDASWRLLPGSGTAVELLAAGGLVETRAAVEQGIGYTFWAATVEQQLAERVTVIALAGYQPFTDGNDRTHLRARLVLDVLPEEGVNLQARWRQYRDSKTDVGGAYFDPESYQQWLAMVGFRKRHSGWTTSGAVGAGREYIRNGGTTTQATYLAELRTEGPIFGDARLALLAVYNRSAGFSNSPDYWWGLVSATLIVPF